MESAIYKGSFTSNGSSVFLPLVGGVDKIEVFNLTQAAAAQTTLVGVYHVWLSSFANGSQWVEGKSNAANAADLTQYNTTGGFTLYDSSLQQPGALNATITGISTANPPLVTVSAPAGLTAGDVVRFSRVVTGQQLGGIDFTVGYDSATVPADTTFSIDYMPVMAAATTGSWRKIPFNPIFYPRRRVITKMVSAGATTVVTTSVPHGYTVGQEVRFRTPTRATTAFPSPMTEINNLIGTIIEVDTDTAVNTFTVDIDSSSFGVFAFPTSSNNAFTPAEVVPVGENTAVALANGLDILGDATVNRATKGLILQGGESFPAGADGDVMAFMVYVSPYQALQVLQ